MAIQSLYPAVRPSLNLDFANTKLLDPRITFTRASTATFYDGRTVAKAEENLLIRSQEFDQTGWTPNASSVVANSVAAPDGTTTSETFTALSGSGIHSLSQASVSVAGTQRVFSCFVKANTHNFVQLMFGTDAQAFANFNVTAGAGAVGTVGSTATASIVDAGNGWYRCIINTSSATANATVYVLLTSSASAARFETWTTVGTESVYLWGAQLEQRSTVTAYTPTTTAPITNYIPVLQTAAANVARFDHNPVTGESLGLLVEGQKTNLLTYSSDFSNAAWSKANAILASNVAVAPDGSITADKLFEDAQTSGHYISPSTNPIVTSGQAYTLSCFIKAAERTYFQLLLTTSWGANIIAGFDLSTGALIAPASGTGTSATISSVGNGWFRCAVTAQATATGSAGIQIRTANSLSNTPSSYTGDGYSGIYVWGAQLEAGTFPSSYIPTTTSQATRTSDSASIAGSNFSSWYRPDEGSVFSEWRLNYANPSVNGSVWALMADASTRSNTIDFFNNNGSSAYEVRFGDVSQAYLTAAVAAGTSHKGAFAYKTNDFARSTNGGAVGSDTTGTVPIHVTTLVLGTQFTGGVTPLYGTLRRLAYYPRRLSNTELQALTT